MIKAHHGSVSVKQRSQEWYNLRQTVRVTASNLNKAVGQDNLKKQQMYFDKMIHGKEDETLSEAQQRAMDYVTKHEIDAIATLVSKILPALYPSLQYFEEGCSIIRLKNRPFFL